MKKLARASGPLVACALLLASGLAFAQDGVQQRRMSVLWDAGVPEVSFSAIDIADAAVRERLNSGLPRPIVMRLIAYTEAGQPIAAAPRSCEVTRDLHDLVYRVRVQERDVDRTERFDALDPVLRRCLVPRRVRVGEADDYAPYRGERIYFAAIVEVSPISAATIHQLRRWLARPPGGGQVDGQSAFFGSFVSLFVNRQIGAAFRTLQLRSQPVTVPR